MRAARLLPLVAVIFLVGSAAAMSPSGVGPVYMPQFRFADYAHLFRYVAADRRFGDPDDESLARRIQADSRIDYVRDRSSEPIAIVRVELLNPDGTSTARSEEGGNWPFYVVRETPSGLVLMGRMFGRAYRSDMKGRHLEFWVELHPASHKIVQMHFRVEDNMLINLSAPHRRWAVFARRN